MDIEGGEQPVLEEIDIHYLCKYVKQFELEYHPFTESLRKAARKALNRLVKCFYLYHRESRFYMHDALPTSWGKTGHLSEFQLRNITAIELASFHDEIEMGGFMFTMGELYFVNMNFL
jgi:hypothetical protein